ncbi:MAG TPA: hypothetical protein VFQ35_24405 [Polyangiaceae bacterium]|nr:hypothetical protein [Polyangiaceae bacterium]
MKSILFVLVPLAIGCSSEDDGALGAPPLHPVPGCEGIEPTSCDVRLPECQSRLLRLTACLRGEDVMVPPPIRVVSEADFTSELTAQFAEQMQDPNSGHVEAGLNMLGMVELGALTAQARAEDYAKSIAGLYNGETKDIAIIDHGDSLAAERASPLLVHEFVHALQDRDLGLDAFKAQATSNDDTWAKVAVIEGEAQLHEMRYAAAMLGLDSDKVDWKARFQNALAHDEQLLLKEKSPYLATYKYFPYEWGGRYMYFTWAAGGMSAVNGRFARPPSTTHTLLASTMMAIDSEITPETLTPPPPSAEWTQVLATTLGAWGVYLAFQKAAPTLDAARAIALAWRGDSLAVYAPSESGSHTAVVWSLELADEGAAAAVAQIAPALAANVRQAGTRIVIAKTDGSGALDWAF